MSRQPESASPAVMVELRNLRRMHAGLKKTNDALRAENRRLRMALAARDETIAGLKKQLADQAVQIAELQQMVFGKRERGGGQSPRIPRAPKPRDKASYRRPAPPPEAVTETKTLSLPQACPCGGDFTRQTCHERFEEDIPLPHLDPGYRARTVTRYRVEKAVCTSCGRTRTAAKDGRPFDLGGQKVRLGSNVRLLVCHLAAMGLSYSQTSHLLASLYGLAVSSGEIAVIIQRQKQAWTPAYQNLQNDIRASPVLHIDETPWPIQSLGGAGYAWVMAAANSPAVCFDLAQSRGAPVARRLLGNYSGLRVTDGYSTYANKDLPGQQQLCWAHLYRAARDLRYNQNLPANQLPFVRRWYADLAGVYAALQAGLAKPFDQKTRTALGNSLRARVEELAGRLPPQSGQPAKLARLKKQLQRAGPGRLFACLAADAPCDNNRAERDLRPLVLKRKRSFGSRTERGAAALATVMSLCATTWRRQPGSYFRTLASLG